MTTLTETAALVGRWTLDRNALAHLAAGDEDAAFAFLDWRGGLSGGGCTWDLRGRTLRLWTNPEARGSHQARVGDVFAWARSRMTAEAGAALVRAVELVEHARTLLEVAHRPGRHFRDPGRVVEVERAGALLSSRIGVADSLVRDVLVGGPSGERMTLFDIPC